MAGGLSIGEEKDLIGQGVPPDEVEESAGTCLARARHVPEPVTASDRVAAREIDRPDASLDRDRARESAAQLSDARARLGEIQQQLIQREKLASLGALTAGIAHELRNPLNFINNFATLTADLVEDVREELGRAGVDSAAIAELLADIKDNVDKINQHGQRADRIINGVLTHARAPTGVHAPTDVNKLVAEGLSLAFHSVRARYPGARVDITADYDPALLPIDADAADLQRVLINLVDNALYVTMAKQRVEGPGYLPTVKVTTRDLVGAVEIRVRDNGSGISPENLEKLFTPFFTTKPPGEGVGLGLSICHDLITRDHGGSLRADSVEGEYAEFIITLPRR